MAQANNLRGAVCKRCKCAGGNEMEKENLNVAEAEEMTMAQGMEEHTVMNIKPGQLLKGKVLKVTAENVFVNINYMSDGIIPKHEYTNDENANLLDLVKENDEIKVVVVKVKDGEGNVLLSHKRAEAEKYVEAIEKALAEGTTVTAKVKEAVKGGLRVDVLGLQGFMPASLAADGYVQDLQTLVGKEFEVNVTEFDKAKRRAVVSRKEIDKKEKAAKRTEALATLAEGTTVEGTVTKLMNYGAFIEIGGIEGLAHISDISWKRINHPSEVLKEGEKVNVTISQINKETGKINLSLKNKENDPWTKVEEYTVGQEVPGKITNIIKSGAFVELQPGLEAYLHISEIADEKIEKVEDKLEKGQEVNVKIKEINLENRKLSVTMRENSPARRERQERFERPERNENRTEKFNAKFEKAGKTERAERPRRERRPSQAPKNEVDRGYQDKTENLTLGDLFGDLKSKLNFTDKE